MKLRKLTLSALALSISAGALGHGLMSEPASRNWLCGAVTKPDQAAPGSACAEAFADDPNGGYQFMSVLTHDVGRAGVSPLPTNVCGFDNETFQGGASPWDKPIDWPTQPFSAGPKTITWDISWGPHFDDTEDFRYWITKPDFQYEVGRALTWDDFESEPFCDLAYDDTNPSANPNVIPDKGQALFHTQCNIPERTGRHVIYGEWGRNQWTYERFHGCIDASFSGGGNPPPPAITADISATPSSDSFTGEGSIQLSGAGSTGSNLSYQWSIEAANPDLYSLSSTSGSTTTLELENPLAESEVTVRLLVTAGSATADSSVTFTHLPMAGSNWADLGSITPEARTLAVGDTVRLRLVRETGEDVYIPSTPLVLTAATSAASAWPYALAQAVNAVGGEVSVGVLNSSGDVVPAQNATSNHIYVGTPSIFADAFVQIESANTSSAPASSSSSSAATSSSPSQCSGATQQCDWYGTTHPVCVSTQSGWGWEDNASCIAATTCSGQPAPFGLVGCSTSSVPASSSSSSISSAAVSSAVSSVSNSSVASGGANCEFIVSNEWSTGFTGAIRITNNGTSAIDGWNVGWSFSDSTRVTSSWNANVTGSNPYTASNIAWNGAIQPGQSVEFGFQGSKGSEAISVPVITGTVCE